MAFPIDGDAKPNQNQQQVDDVDDDRGDRVTPLKYVPLCDVYSATSPYVGGATGSKKVKAARKILPHFDTDDDRTKHYSHTQHIYSMSATKPPLTHFYTRRRKRKRQDEPSFYDTLESGSVKLGSCNGDVGEEEEAGRKYKEKQKRKASVKLRNLSNGNREDECEDKEMVVKNKEKQKKKVDNSKLVFRPVKIGNFVNGDREDEGEDEEMVVKSKGKQKRKVFNSKLVSRSAKLANLSNGDLEDKGEDEEMVIMNKEKQKLTNFSNDSRENQGETEGEEDKVVIKIKEKRKVGNLEVVNMCVKSERDNEGEDDVVVVKHNKKKKEKKRRKVGSSELANLGVDDSVMLNESCLRETRNSACKNKTDTNHSNNDCKDSNFRGNNIKKRKENSVLENHLSSKSSGSIRTKKWVWLSFEGVDPKKFNGLQCKVYWPLDADWYSGRVIAYNSETGRHHVKYVDGDEEHLLLSNERVKFSVSLEEISRLKLRSSDTSPETDGIDVDEMVVLAATLDDCEALEPGDIIWAKLTGHAMWPAIVLDESLAGGRKGLNKVSGEKSVLVQFFGTHDFARVKLKQVISFLRGLLSSFHLKCKKPKFVQGLEEAKMYLTEQKLSKRMLRIQNRITADNNTESEEGKIVEDSELFRDEKYIWPEGYTAVRKFPSVTDPGVRVSYKMEVLRDPDFRTRPLFRVTSDSGEQVFCNSMMSNQVFIFFFNCFIHSLICSILL
nr:histone-lysine N-methyltransferase ATX2-like isoform X3 [Nicotiana tomentosiformis]